MSFSTYQYQLRELATPVATRSTYCTIYPQIPARCQPASIIERLACRQYVHTGPCPSTTTHGVPAHIASALASWSIPSKSWIHYYNGTYVWPAGLAIPDPRVLLLEPSVIPTTAFLPKFTSNMANGLHQLTNNQISSTSQCRQQIRRTPAVHSSSLRDQYSTGSQPGSIGPQSTQSRFGTSYSSVKSTLSCLQSSSEDICPPPGFDDPKSLDDKLIDLRAIVKYIVPAGGVDPNAHYGTALGRLKYTSADMNEGIEHFIRDAEAQDPKFMDKLAGFGNDRPDDFRGASPSDDWRMEEMYKWEYIKHQGEWMKPNFNAKGGYVFESADQNALPQIAHLNDEQPHPAQCQDELNNQSEYDHAKAYDDHASDLGGDFDDDFSLVGDSKRVISKKGSPKWQKGIGTVRRRSSPSGKSKRATKQQKMDRESKYDEHRSCIYLY